MYYVLSRSYFIFTILTCPLVPLEDGLDCHPDDAQVEPQTPVLDIPDVAFHSSLHLPEFAGLACETKVLQIVYLALGLCIMHNQGTSLKRVKHLGGMKREGAHIASKQDRSPPWGQGGFHPKGMRGIVDDLQTIMVGNPRYLSAVL